MSIPFVSFSLAQTSNPASAAKNPIRQAPGEQVSDGRSFWLGEPAPEHWERHGNTWGSVCPTRRLGRTGSTLGTLFVQVDADQATNRAFGSSPSRPKER